jgi:hypothetical protein
MVKFDDSDGRIFDEQGVASGRTTRHFKLADTIPRTYETSFRIETRGHDGKVRLAVESKPVGLSDVALGLGGALYGLLRHFT